MGDSKLIKPHGADELKILLLEGKAKEEELKKAETLPKITMTSRETAILSCSASADSPRWTDSWVKRTGKASVKT